MPDLKLIAFDEDDLRVMSAHLQDAVVRVSDMAFLPRERRFAMMANRFDWVDALAPEQGRAARKRLKRRRTGLRFERVLGAKVQGIDLSDKRVTLALLTVSFTPSTTPEAPDGDVTLTFSGGAAIRLSVECLEAELKDLGAVWSAKRAPEHSDDTT
jgi:hypothetical protein